MRRTLLLAATLSPLVVAPVVESKTEELQTRIVAGNPWRWNGAGFFFAPDRVNAEGYACALPKEAEKHQAFCPPSGFEEMVEKYKKARPDDELTLKEPELINFFLNCLEDPERRFTEDWPQPDGVLYVGVIPTEECRGFALKWTYFGFYMAWDLVQPNLGLALEHPVKRSDEYVERLKTEQRPEVVALASLDGIQAQDLSLTISQDLIATYKAKYKEETGIEAPEESKRPIEVAVSSSSSSSSSGLTLLERRVKHFQQHLDRHQRRRDRVGERVPFSTVDVPATVLAAHVVQYAFDATVKSRTKAKIRKAIRSWTKQTCVEWREIVLADVGADDYTFSSPAAGGGSWVDDQSVNIDPQASRTEVEHELGHVLGLGHTQQREDRDAYITWTGHLNNDISQHETRTMSLARGAGWARRFDNDNPQPGLFDWKSVMLYGSYGPNDDYVAKTLADYTVFEQWLYDWAFGTGGYPPSVGTWGFTGSTYGGKTASPMDSHIVNLKWSCYATDPDGPTVWDLGASVKRYTDCAANYKRRVVTVKGGEHRPLCQPPQP